MDLTSSLVGALPKVALHDHLDGGVRAATVLELSRELGLPVPGLEDAGDAAAWASPGAAAQPTAEDATPRGQEEVRAVADWFHTAADSGSLPAYLSTFDHTVALMQTAPHLRRIAREFVEDMVADGVVYAETRWAPHQHTAGGLTLDAAVQAVQDGLDEGVAAAEATGRRIVVGQLLCYLRHLDPTDDLVEIALARQETGVLGLDLAGPEAGYPASWFRAQFDRARDAGLRVTIHAGEADGPSSIADALDCGAERIGHGARLLEDIDDAAGADAAGDDAAGDDAAPSPRFGRVAARVHAGQICLEVCPSSNLQTGGAPDMPSHQVGPLYQHGFAIALSSDNRLMSRTRTSREMLLAAQAFDWTLEDLERIVLTGLDAGFAPAAQRQALREEVVLPTFAAARAADQHQDQYQPPARSENPLDS
ncbi:adenosine deaminase family protein [Brachybacterium sp.]|uniref:adenosine deaminase family protein n=1 Tax=Brachybacterium sp. TaxID=1891286 RepID=UPI002ED18F65